MHSGHPVELRREAIECLRVWNQRPYLDRVEGRARHLSLREPDFANELLQENSMALFAAANGGLRSTVTQAIRRNGLDVPVGVLHQWLNDSKQAVEIRVDALRLIQQKDADSLSESLAVAMESELPSLRLAALEIESKSDVKAFLDRHESLQDYSLREKQGLISLLQEVPGADANAIALEYLRSLEAGSIPDELALDIATMARARFQESGTEPSLDESDYQYSSLGGDPKRGKEVYETHVAAQCVRCHNAGGNGKQVGPVLSGIGKQRDNQYLLESILQPSASIAEGFQTVSVETNDGESYDGVIVSEDSERLVMGLTIGETQIIPKNTIFSRSASEISAMPSMKGVLNPMEVRDLVAYLREL